MRDVDDDARERGGELLAGAEHGHAGAGGEEQVHAEDAVEGDGGAVGADGADVVHDDGGMGEDEGAVAVGGELEAIEAEAGEGLDDRRRCRRSAA